MGRERESEKKGKSEPRERKKRERLPLFFCCCSFFGALKKGATTARRRRSQRPLSGFFVVTFSVCVNPNLFKKWRKKKQAERKRRERERERERAQKLGKNRRDAVFVCKRVFFLPPRLLLYFLSAISFTSCSTQSKLLKNPSLKAFP